jgi:predicted enzyme related to lactoylglutathione lyase
MESFMGKRAIWIPFFIVGTATTTTGAMMPSKDDDGRVDYIEFNAKDIGRAKTFYSEAFWWKFTDYGPDYTSFEDGRLTGGFQQGGATTGGPLVVIYATDLESTRSRVEKAGGTVTKPIFSFPGGRRFHFRDPNGNELAVWSDK